MPLIHFETEPDRYAHWRLTFDGPVARLILDVREDRPLRPGYLLKLNSYDLGVDIELADALQRIRFEHPEVKALVLTSGKERIFCAGANILMLAGSSHPFKVNFCKFTNETRLYLEELAEETGVRTLCAVNGICAGGGYELALACERIVLVDDGSAAVSLPETPLLGVLPGTGGLTRLVDKRKVRRDRADVFGTTAEGMRGRRAVEWGLVDRVAPLSRFNEAVQEELDSLLAGSRRRTNGLPVLLPPLEGKYEADRIEHRHVLAEIDSGKRTATITVRGPSGPASTAPLTPESMSREGSDFWPLRAFRELDDVLLHLRTHHETVGVLLLKTEGDPEAVRRIDSALAQHNENGFVREVLLLMKRTLKRLDLTARSTFALITPGSCFAGSLFELALSADRSYMRNDPQRPAFVGLSAVNRRRALGPAGDAAAGAAVTNAAVTNAAATTAAVAGEAFLPTSCGLTRLETRFYGEPGRLVELGRREELFDADAALEAGLVTFAPDDIDWEDEVRIAVEERASLSPDALTGMEANLRFPGPETMESKIFARLSAWQNWIFTRPNSTGEKGALTLYGKPDRPEFDWRRT